MNSEDFWKTVKQYNVLMKEAIDGPNCIDENICHGDCCSIKIDVPKILAIEYIKRNNATPNDFIRSNVFSFHLRFDEKTGKCFLFDQKINGCSVHNSGIKPPQCWIYPTNFSNPENRDIKCKKISGWKIIDDKKAKTAEKLLREYIDFSMNEAIGELNKISERINENNLKMQIIDIAPSKIGGFKDTWDQIKILPADGYSLQMKKFCNKYNEQCEILQDNFIECKKTCDIIASKLIDFLNKYLIKYVKENELDIDGDYPLFKLFSFTKESV